MSIGVFLREDAGVVLIGDDSQADQCLVLTEMKECQLIEIGLWENEVLKF